MIRKSMLTPAIQAAAKIAAERAQRVEHLKESALRRLGNLDLSHGWSSWFVQHKERQRIIGILQRATANLAQPKQMANLRGSFVQWRDDWELFSASWEAPSPSREKRQSREAPTYPEYSPRERLQSRFGVDSAILGP